MYVYKLCLWDPETLNCLLQFCRKLKKDVEMVKSGQWDDKLPEIYQQMLRSVRKICHVSRVMATVFRVYQPWTGFYIRTSSLLAVKYNCKKSK